MPLEFTDLFTFEELTPIIASSSASLHVTDSLEELDAQGQRINLIHKPRRLGLGPRDFWNALKAEFWLLTCTNARKYSALRKKVREGAAKSQTTAVSLIAVSLGATLGVIPALLTPFVAMLIAFFLKVGKEAFCRAVRDAAPGGLHT